MKLGIIMKQIIVCFTVLVFLVGTAQAATIIGGTVGNGDFEDFSGGWVEAGGTAGVNGTYPNYTRIWRSAGVDLTSGIDGWTARYRGGYVSFDTRTDAVPTGNKSFNLNQWSLAHLTSDTYNVTLAEGDEIQLTFDTSGSVMRMSVCVILDKGLTTESTCWLVGDAINYVDFVTTGTADIQNAGDYSYTLGIGESASTVTLFFTGYREDQGGADYGMIKRENGTGIIDNVELTVIEGVPSTDYYVATVANGGDDSNPGTLAEPFATIQHAASQIQPGYTVYIREGTYRETVTPAQSGAAGYPITFEAYNGEQVIISGCDLVEGWTNHSGNIWKATVNWSINGGDGDTVFTDGQLKFEARHPNSSDPMDRLTWGTQTTLDTTNGEWFYANDLQGFGDDYWNGALVRNHFQQWVLRTDTIADYESGTGKITFATPWGHGMQKAGYHYYIFRDYKCLDADHEWFKDVGTNTLYYQFPTSTVPNDYEIEFKSRAYAFNLDGKDHIHIKGIEFRGASMDTDSSTDYNVYEDNVFVGFDKDNFGRWWINGTNHLFINNEVKQTWTGISLVGTHNRIINNYFHDMGYNGGNSGALYMGGSDNLVSYNTFSNIGRNVAQGNFKRYEIEYNIFEDCGNLTYDTGCIEWNDGEGAIIHHNIFRNNDDAASPFSGIYHGGIPANTVWHHNLFYNVSDGFATTNAVSKGFVIFANNTFYGDDPLLGGGGPYHSTKYLNNLHTTSQNINTDLYEVVGNFAYTGSDFVDTANDDYRLAAGSGAIDVGVLVPGITETYNGNAPDAGAIEQGDPMFNAGHDFVNPPDPLPEYDWQLLPMMNLLENPNFESSLSGWTYVGTPVRFDGNSWNYHGTGGLSLPHGGYSVQFNPGEAMSKTITGLKPNTWYVLGATCRNIGHELWINDPAGQSGSFTPDYHRSDNALGGFDSGEWLRYDNIDFGSGTALYNRIELSYSWGDVNHSIEAWLDSPTTGTLLGTFTFVAFNDAWYVAPIDIPSVTGTHSVYLVSKSDSASGIFSRLRFVDTNIGPDKQLTMGVRNYGSSESGLEVSTLIGSCYYPIIPWSINFKTGTSSTSATIFFEHNGSYFDAYLDSLALFERDPYDENVATAGTASQSSTSGGNSASYANDGIVLGGTVSQTNDVANSWWQVDLGEAKEPYEILLTAPESNPGRLSNVRVSVWEGDPESGAAELWARDYLDNASLSAGETFVIKHSDVADDNTTELSDVQGRFVRVQLNGNNRDGDGILSAAEVKVIEYDYLNLAQTSGLASQSSTAGDAFAGLAIDGNIDPDFANGSITSTQDLPNSWWQVEFPAKLTIGQIKLFNQNGTAANQLSNFKVSVWDVDPGRGGVQLWSKDYYAAGNVPSGGILTIDGGEIADDGITRLSSIFGSVVRIQLNGYNNAGNGILSLAEVKVYDTAKKPLADNLSLTGTATQSANHYYQAGYAPVAADGNVNPYHARGSVSHTKSSSQPWWQVDLHQTPQFDQIVVINRYEIPERLTNFRVSILNSSDSEVWGRNYYPSGNPGAGGSLIINAWDTSDTGTRLEDVTGGQKVKVQLHGSGILSLAEVQVWTAAYVDVPNAPTNLQAEQTWIGQVNLSWDDNSNDETSFIIQRRTESQGIWQDIEQVSANVTTFLDTGLAESETYSYRVCASNSAGRSDYSNTVSIDTTFDLVEFSWLAQCWDETISFDGEIEYDGFNYTSGESLNAQPGWSNFIHLGGNEVVITTDQATENTLADDGIYKMYIKALDTPMDTTGDVYYFSAKVTPVAEATSSGQIMLLGWANNNEAGQKLEVRYSNYGTGTITVTGDANYTSTTGVDAVPGRSYLLVVKTSPIASYTDRISVDVGLFDIEDGGLGAESEYIYQEQNYTFQYPTLASQFSNLLFGHKSNVFKTDDLLFSTSWEAIQQVVNNGPACESLDFNPDGQIDIADLSIFTLKWLQ